MFEPENGRAFGADEPCPSRSSDFPIEDTVTDFAGRKRTFVITAHEGPMGYTLQACEKMGNGYEIDMFDPTSPWIALGALRHKMRRLLSTRHIERGELGWGATHDIIRGRVTCSEEDAAPAVIVDGVTLSWEEFGRIVGTHEGFDFTIRFHDRGDDLP